MLRSGRESCAIPKPSYGPGFALRPSVNLRSSLLVGRKPQTKSLAIGEWLTALLAGQRAAQTAPTTDEAFAPTTSRPVPSAPATVAAAPRRDFLEARQVSIFALFDAEEFKFDIPIYQRPYSWGKKQVWELLQDLQAAYNQKQEYFLGAIVATRGDDGAAVPYQVIDGQQRLTTLTMLLACLHDWAASTNKEALKLRVQRMLYMEPDPLGYEGAAGRYRLRLRGADDSFFRENILEAFLPTPFRFAGAPAAASTSSHRDAWDGGGTHTTRQAHSGGGGGAFGDGDAVDGAEGADGGTAAAVAGSVPVETLENETWWRMYDNASFMQQHLEEQVANGLNLQEFMFYCLRSCYLVLMTARDEEASFRIFSTLNGRGMDLSPVDKLKADLLQVLNPYEQRRYAAAWAEMEGLLGRPAFHRVFDHMRALASAADPVGTAGLSVTAYFTRQLGDAEVVAQLIQAALDYSALLLQLRQARWSSPSLELLLAPAAQEASGDGSPAAAFVGATGAAAAARRAAMQAAMEAQYPSTAAALRHLSAQSQYMNLFVDDAWLPATLEFCVQCDNFQYRLKFMQAAEALQLLLELQGDASAKSARWREVMCTLLARPVDISAVLRAVALTDAERAAFRNALNSREYGTTADPRTTQHLLLRCEELEASQLSSMDLSSLQVEKIAPQNAPEGSLWRKTKVTIAPPMAHAHAAAHSQNGEASNGSGAAEAAAAAAATTSGTSSSGSTEVKYWYDVQRLYWHNRLGNMVLLPVALSGVNNAVTADFDAKVAYYSHCGAMGAFPRFSGGLAPGAAYGRQKFSFDECRVRHTDVYTKLVKIFELE